MDGQHNPEDVWLNPVFPFEDWTLETRNVATDPIVKKLLDLAPRHKSVLGGAGTNCGFRRASRTAHHDASGFTAAKRVSSTGRARVDPSLPRLARELERFVSIAGARRVCGLEQF
jgi:hypothetical protein